MNHHNWSFQVFRCDPSTYLFIATNDCSRDVELFYYEIGSGCRAYSQDKPMSHLKQFYPEKFQRLAPGIRAQVRAYLAVHAAVHAKCSACKNALSITGNLEDVPACTWTPDC